MMERNELYEAVEAGELDLVSHLLAQGHDPNDYEYPGKLYKCEENLPLGTAASFGDMPMINLLLNAGADLSRDGGYPWLPAISHAAREGHLELVRMLHVDSARRTMFEHGALPVGEFVADQRIDTVSDGRFDKEVDVAVAGTSFGRIQFGIDIAPFQQILANTRQWTISISLLEMFLVAIFSLFLDTYLTRQLTALRDASRAISGGQRGQRLAVSGNDELAETALAFNEMSAKLEESESARAQETETLRIHDARLRRQLAALKGLNEVVAKTGLDPESTLRHALEIGIKHLHFEFGIVSRISDDTYRIIVQSSPPDTLVDNQVFPLGSTYCSTTLARNELLAIADAANSEYAGHPCFKDFQLAAYIGMRGYSASSRSVQVSRGPPYIGCLPRRSPIW